MDKYIIIEINKLEADISYWTNKGLGYDKKQVLDLYTRLKLQYTDENLVIAKLMSVKETVAYTFEE